MALVDAVVDDGDLHPLAARREARPPERRRVDGGDAPVEARPELDARVDLADAWNPLEPLD
jgi:hypothetical protein